MDMFAVYDYGELSFSPAPTRLRHNVPNVVDAGEDQGTVKMHHDELRSYRRLQIGDSEVCIKQTSNFTQQKLKQLSPSFLNPEKYPSLSIVFSNISYSHQLHISWINSNRNMYLDENKISILDHLMHFRLRYTKMPKLLQEMHVLLKL
jgi:hypothetical protein